MVDRHTEHPARLPQISDADANPFVWNTGEFPQPGLYLRYSTTFGYDLVNVSGDMLPQPGYKFLGPLPAAPSGEVAMQRQNRNSKSRGHEYERVGAGKYEILLHDIHCQPRVVIATTSSCRVDKSHHKPA